MIGACTLLGMPVVIHRTFRATRCRPNCFPGVPRPVLPRDEINAWSLDYTGHGLLACRMARDRGHGARAARSSAMTRSRSS